MTNRAAVFAAGVAFAFSSAFSVSAATWVGAAGSFTNGANWDSGAVPTNGVSASVDNGGTAQFDGGVASLATLTLGNVWGASGSLVMSAGVLSNSTFFVGNYGAGSATQSGGDIVVTVASADPACGIGTLTNGSDRI